MGLISKTYTFSAGAVIVAAEHNTNFDQLFNLVNGSLDNANIDASAGIVMSKLNLTSDATFTGDITFSNSATTDDIVSIDGNSLTTGDAFDVSSTSTSTGSRSMIIASSTSTAATGVAGLTLDIAGGTHINLTGDTSNSSPTDGDLWFDGSALNMYVGTATTDLLAGLGTPDYDSTWFTVTAGTDYQKAHGLAVRPNLTQVYFDTTAAGTNPKESFYQWVSDTAVTWGMYVGKMDATNLSLLTGSEKVAIDDDTTDRANAHGTGYARVLAWKGA